MRPGPAGLGPPGAGSPGAGSSGGAPPGSGPAGLGIARAARGWGLALLALGIGLCFVPLFNLLAFEFAFAVGLLAAPCGLGLALRARRSLGPEARPAAVLQAGARAAGLAVGLLAVPLVPISLNALRIQNCNYLEGLAFYGLLTVVNAVVGALWGTALAQALPRPAGARDRRTRALGAVLLVGSVALNLWRFYAHPPVDAFNAFFGYWPGAIYDEVVPIGLRLGVSRLEDVAWGLAALGLALALRTGFGGGVRAGARANLGARLAVAAAALALAFGARQAAVAFDLHRDAAHLQRALGGHLASAHFDVYYPAEWPAATAQALATNLEFEFAELRDFFGVAPARVSAWLYTDTAHKKRLLGAARTRIAKPWQRALHVHAPAVGQPVLRHELAHVFSAEVTPPPFHLPLWAGVVPHMPLIEGLAEAAAWPTERLDLHQWSAALRRLPGVAVDVRAVLSPTGFYAHNGRLAYTVCGSFLAFYGAREGREALLEAYRAGRFAPERLDAAVQAWSAMLDGLPEDPRVAQYARERFDQPAIFGKTCAHEMAALRADLAERLGAGQGDAALAVLDRILGHVPGDVEARLVRIGVLFAQSRAEEAEALAAALAADARAGARARHTAAEWVADLQWHRGALAEASAAYAAEAAVAFDRNDERRLAVKQAALAASQAGDAARAEAGALVRTLLMAVPGTTAATVAARFERLAAVAPDWAVGGWLRARHAAATGAPEAALALLASLDTAALPHPALRLEAARLAAHLRFAAGEHAQAAAEFAALAEPAQAQALGLSAGEVAGLAQWARRARFFAAAGVGAGAGPGAATSGGAGGG